MTRRGLPLLTLAGCVACAVAVGSERLASAQPASLPERLSLDWSSRPACSSGPQVMASVARVLRPAPASSRHVAARASVERLAGGAWRVSLTLESEGAARGRSFDAESCTAAVDAVSLILSVALDQRQSFGPPDNPATPAPLDVSPPPPASTPATPALPASAPPPAPPPATPPPAQAPTRPAPRNPRPAFASRESPPRGFEVALSAAMDAGNLPAPAVGVELAVGWRLGVLRLEAAGDSWAPETATASGAGARFQLLSGALRVAGAWPVGAFGLGPLLELGAESLHASGFGGTVANRAPGEALGTVGGGGLFAWRPTRRLGLRLVLESLVPLARPSFVVLNGGAPTAIVHRPSAAFARALLGAEVQFP